MSAEETTIVEDVPQLNIDEVRAEAFQEGVDSTNEKLDYFSVVALERIATALEKHLIVTCALRMRSMTDQVEDLLDKVLLPVLLSHKENNHYATPSTEEPDGTGT